MDGFVNADPHGGNFLLMPDGRIGLIDYGQVAQERRKPKKRERWGEKGKMEREGKGGEKRELLINKTFGSVENNFFEFS